MCQPSKPSEADGSEQGHLQPPSPTLCSPPRAQPPAAQPRAHQLLPWQLHTRLWGCSWESLKPEHHGMTVDQLLWHQCISEDYLLSRLFTLNHQEWTGDAPDSWLSAVMSRAQSVSFENRSQGHVLGSQRDGPDMCLGTSITVFSPFKEGNLPGFWEFRAQ